MHAQGISLEGTDKKGNYAVKVVGKDDYRVIDLKVRAGDVCRVMPRWGVIVSGGIIAYYWPTASQ